MFFFFLLLFFSLAGSPLWIFFLFLLPWSVLFFLSFSGSLEKSPSLIRSGSLPPLFHSSVYFFFCPLTFSPFSFFFFWFPLPLFFPFSFSGSPLLLLPFHPFASFFFFKRTHPLSFLFSFWFLPFPVTTVFFLALLLLSPPPNSLPSMFLSFFFLSFFSQKPN